jgi:hypothetical protein
VAVEEVSMLTPKINTILLCAVILLLIFLPRHCSTQVGRFQLLDTPARQLAFDTATGQRCWVWLDKSDKGNPGSDDVPLCSELAKK